MTHPRHSHPVDLQSMMDPCSSSSLDNSSPWWMHTCHTNARFHCCSNSLDSPPITVHRCSPSHNVNFCHRHLGAAALSICAHSTPPTCSLLLQRNANNNRKTTAPNTQLQTWRSFFPRYCLISCRLSFRLIWTFRIATSIQMLNYHPSDMDLTSDI